MPFIGLAEAYALAAFRHAEVPMQRIRPAIDVLARELVVVRNNQRVFTEVIELAADGYAQLIRLPQCRVSEVTIDPDHEFGRPRFVPGGSAVDNVIDLFRAGEPVDTVAEEFGLISGSATGKPKSPP